ncbi:MAG: small multi-drug export protein [Cyclobacteriaceae bacterium]
MWAEILKALSVYVSSMVKFIFGPIGGKAAGLHLITTMVVTAAGMMTVVIAFTYFGEYIRKIITRWTSRRKEPKVETPKKRSEFFRKYGLAGIAFFTPIILTPIGGTLLAVGISPNREKIIFYMLISACVWSVILTFAVYFGYDAVMNIINKVQPV